MRSLRREFRSYEASSVRVVLLDGGKQPLATFGERLSGKAAKELEHLGVELRMGARVVGVDATGVDISDSAGTTSRLDAYTTVWAAGVEASPLAAELAKATGAELDRAGRIAVLADLTLPGHPEVFVVGDMTALDNLPGVAEVAMQGGLHAANTIVRRLEHKQGNPFKYRDLGTAATIGRFKSVVNFHGLLLSGFPGWVIWAFVHLTFLTGFGNRVSTLLKWARSFIGRGRPEREFSVMHTGGDLSLPLDVRADGRLHVSRSGSPGTTCRRGMGDLLGGQPKGSKRAGGQPGVPVPDRWRPLAVGRGPGSNRRRPRRCRRGGTALRGPLPGAPPEPEASVPGGLRRAGDGLGVTFSAPSGWVATAPGRNDAIMSPEHQVNWRLGLSSACCLRLRSRRARQWGHRRSGLLVVADCQATLVLTAGLVARPDMERSSARLGVKRLP